VKTFPIKKIINTEQFIDRKWGFYLQKDRRDWISKEYRISQKKVKILAGNNYSRSEKAAACLGELTNTWKRS